MYVWKLVCKGIPSKSGQFSLTPSKLSSKLAQLRLHKINAKNLNVIDTNQTRQTIQTKVSIIEQMKTGSLFHLMFWTVPTGNSFVCLFTVMCQITCNISQNNILPYSLQRLWTKKFLLWLVNTCYPSFIFDKCYNLFQLN